jgi:hypothetical protein
VVCSRWRLAALLTEHTTHMSTKPLSAIPMLLCCCCYIERLSCSCSKIPRSPCCNAAPK